MKSSKVVIMFFLVILALHSIQAISAPLAPLAPLAPESNQDVKKQDILNELMGDVLEQRSNGLSGGEKSLIVARHNGYRSEVKPTASNMVAMEWDNKLGRLAQARPKKCDPAKTEVSTGDFSYIGQNVALVSPSVTLGEVLDSWNDEGKRYRYFKKRCAGLKFNCDNYTQVVWAESAQIGCGKATCEEGVLFVCYYAPGGNIASNSPYETGEPCSACPNDGNAYTCNNNLCTA